MYDSMCFGLCLQKVEKLALSVEFSCICVCVFQTDVGFFYG